MRSFAAILFLLSAPAFAQAPDTTSAWRYFPLEVGNAWEYESNFYSCGPECGPDELLGFWRWTAVDDSTVGGTDYLVIRRENFTAAGSPEDEGYEFLARFDTLTAHPVTRSQEGDESPWVIGCRLDLPFDSKPVCDDGHSKKGAYGDYAVPVQVGNDEVVTAVKAFLNLVGGVEFAADLGLTRISGGKISVWEDALTYARIGGVEYGLERFPVANETAASPGPGVALSIYPNPARDAATLSLTLDRPQRVTLAVYDVLGRQVLTEDLGAAVEQTHWLDLGGLRPGVYVVQLRGKAGARATTRLVVQ